MSDIAVKDGCQQARSGRDGGQRGGSAPKRQKPCDPQLTTMARLEASADRAAVQGGIAMMVTQRLLVALDDSEASERVVTS